MARRSESGRVDHKVATGGGRSLTGGMKNPDVLVPLAKGFEEIEGIGTVDVLRRAGMKVVTAGLPTVPVEASRGTTHVPDVILDHVLEREFDLIVLPGGRPGADNLAAHAGLIRMLERQAAEGRWIAAICAAPLVLDRAGLLVERRFTIHPGSAAELRTAQPVGGRVVVDGRLITGIAAGATLEFALEIVRLMLGTDAAEKVNCGLLAAWQP